MKRFVVALNDDRYFLVVVDISTNPEYYDPRILFYDQKLQLVSAAYFLSERIESLDDGVINGFLNKETDM